MSKDFVIQNVHARHASVFSHLRNKSPILKKIKSKLNFHLLVSRNKHQPQSKTI